jgi:hypothetical protein
MAYETRSNKIFGTMDIAGLNKDEIIEKAMKVHNLKKITATNYYYEWNRSNKLDKPEEQKESIEDEAVEKILNIINTKPQSEMATEVMQWTNTEDEEKAAEVVVETAAKIQIENQQNKFKLKKMQFAGDNGEYYIDNNTFMLSNSEGSLTFANEGHWRSFKAEIDAAFDYLKNMEVLNCE